MYSLTRAVIAEDSAAHAVSTSPSGSSVTIIMTASSMDAIRFFMPILLSFFRAVPRI